MRSAVLMPWGVAFFLVTGSAQATVQVAIDLTHQRMHVVSSHGSYDWPISSARSGFYTPGGSFAPTRMELMHYSKKYHMSPMPHAIFFRGGYAIHGTYATASLGRPASHGCVRLSPGNAAVLYAMVKAEGAQISIDGTPPASRVFARPYGTRRHPPRVAAAGSTWPKRATRHAPAKGTEDASRDRSSYTYQPYPYSYGYGSP